MTASSRPGDDPSLHFAFPQMTMAMIAVAVAVWGMMGTRFAAANDETRPPNFVLILVDDLGYADIGPFGSRTNPTPHLDRMAAEGRKLTSHYAAPVCSPSRAALLTGCYPKRVLPIPHVLFPAAAVGLNPDEVTLAELLKSAGYATACIGKWHLGDQAEFLPTRQGFDSYFGIPYSNDMGPPQDGSKSNPGSDPPRRRPPNAREMPDETGLKGLAQPPLPLLENDKVVARVRGKEQFDVTRQYTERAVRFIREHADRPFFLYLPHTAVHFPLYPSESFRGKSTNGLVGDWAVEVDWSVGQVLDAVRDSGIAEETIVLFVSDNGGALNQGSKNTPLRGSKGQTYEGGIRVCAVAWGPGRIPAGTSTAAMTSHLDILPTFAKLAQAPLPEGRVLDGVDIWPALTGDAQPREQFCYFRGPTLEAFRDGPWKLHLKRNELYRLDEDLAEANNLAKTHPHMVERLRAAALAAAGELGADDFGPACRPLGRVQDPQPLIDQSGHVRPDARGETDRFP